tara:strand:+ start:5663 stop:5905 length:243 start_codon:yes stop_codon:yes gene_type:complete
MTINELFNIIEESISIDKDEITDETSTENVAGWDSLGHITLLSELDEITDGASADIPELANVSSVKELIAILKDNNLLDG